MSAVLELEGLTVRRGRRDVLADVTLGVAAGEMLGLVGPNGAGKTTLLRAALGLQPYASGAVRLAGRPLESLSERERAAHPKMQDLAHPLLRSGECGSDTAAGSRRQSPQAPGRRTANHGRAAMGMRRDAGRGRCHA